MQKLQKLLYPALTLCFVLGILGYYLGRQSVDGLILSTQTPAPSETLSRSIPENPPESGPNVTKRVELNHATLEDLMSLPGIGAIRAQRILDYREANGPFRQTTELMNVSGIGAGIFASLRDYVYVEENDENTDH